MDKKGFIDIAEISPMAAGLGAIAAIVGFVVSSRADAGIFWTILSTGASGVVGFLIAQKMSDAG